MKYIVGITETENYTKQNEILSPHFRINEDCIRILKVQAENIEARYAIGSCICNKDSNSRLNAITEYLRTLKSFDTAPAAEKYKNELLNTILKLMEEGNLEAIKAYIYKQI